MKDEALMSQRLGALGHREHARALLDRARLHFDDIGMSGWLRHATHSAMTLEARS